MASRAQVEFLDEGADFTGEGEDFQNFKMASRAFRPFGDKRYILTNRVSTLPWGHYRIPELETHERLELEPDESLGNPIV